MQDGTSSNIEVLGSLVVLPEGSWGEKVNQRYRGRLIEPNAHLSSSENQSLLGWRHTRLLLYFLFDTRYLSWVAQITVCSHAQDSRVVAPCHRRQCRVRSNSSRSEMLIRDPVILYYTSLPVRVCWNSGSVQYVPLHRLHHLDSFP